MGSPRRSQRHMKRDVDGGSDVRRDRAGDDEVMEVSEKRKQKSGKSKKSEDREEIDVDTSGKQKSSVERHATRKRSADPSQVDSDEDDYDSRKQSYSKQAKKKQEESTLEMLSHWYQDGEVDGKHERLDESQKISLRKSSSKFIDHEGSKNRSKIKERSHDDDNSYSEKRESREKSREYSDQDKSTRKTLEDADIDGKTEENSYSENCELRGGKLLDSTHGSFSERSSSIEAGEDKGKTPELSSERGKSTERTEGKVNVERIRTRSRSDAPDGGNRSGSLPVEDVVGKERSQIHRDVGHPRRSKTPETSCDDELGKSEIDHEPGVGFKRKELDKDGQVSDKVKTGDESPREKSRDREGSRESYKRRQSISNDRDLDSSYERDREWDLPRRGRDRMDNERPSGRSGNRNDIRGIVVKASSNDVIEIQTKPHDYGRGDLATALSRKNDVGQSDLKTAANDLPVDQNRAEAHISVSAGDKDKGTDDGLQDQNAWRDDADSQGVSRGQKVPVPGRVNVGQLPYGNQESGSLGRPIQPGGKGGRLGRPNRVRPPARDNQQMNMNVPLMPPFGPLSMPPPGAIPSMNPSMSPGPGSGIPPGVFVPPFSPNVWPGARSVDLSVMPASPGMSPFPSGPPGQRFGPNIGNPPNSVMFYNHPGRGMPSNVSGSGFNVMAPNARAQSIDKVSGGWVPPKGNAPPGKAPSRGEQNDYSQNFVDTGMRPQNFIRELELTNVEDYPKLRELIQKKDEIVDKASSPPMYYKADLREFVLSPEFFATKFDVILVDPPWEEYVHRAAGVTDHMESWTFEDIMNIKIEAIADTPSFIFLWVGDGIGLEQGRQCLKKWGFRRCEDICWVKTNKNTATPSLRHSNTLFQHSKEHCLMGIKGTVRRSTDGHIIHANIDTDVIIAEEPPYGSTKKPDEIYRIIEHFALGRRRIELFGEDHNIRPGWLTVGKGLSSSNFNSEAYTKNFSDKDGKVWQGGGGRNPPPEAPHLVQTTPEIESLRPKSPMKNQQQMQQQSSSISLTAASSSGRKPPGNAPQTPNPYVLNPEASADHLAPPWGPMEAMRGREAGNMGPRDNVLDMYGYNGPPPPMLPNGEFLDFDARRSMNLM